MFQSQICSNSTVSAVVPVPPSPCPNDAKSNGKRSLSDDIDDRTNKRLQNDGLNNNKDPVEQTVWGATLPEGVLYKIFQYVVEQEGCLPSLCRLGRVCVLWHCVSLSPSLWTHLDLCRWSREGFRTVGQLKWIIKNRMTFCQDVTLTGFKVTPSALSILAKTCPHLTGIKLTIGWKGLSSENLNYLAKQVKSLERIDLNSINLDGRTPKSTANLQSLCAAIQTMNERLTHLHLTKNYLNNISQVFTTLSAYCPNLILLDLSHSSVSNVIDNIGQLQQGCKKLKVLRINDLRESGPTTLPKQMDWPGFPDLEELNAEASCFIDDNFLQLILKSSTKLQLLDVRRCDKLSYRSLIQLYALDLKRLFLYRMSSHLQCGLELIALKWTHSLIEFQLSGANQQDKIDKAIKVIARKGAASRLKHLNLSESNVSLKAVKLILIHCPHLNSLNLTSCRLQSAPRNTRKLLQGQYELQKLRNKLGVVQNQ